MVVCIYVDRGVVINETLKYDFESTIDYQFFTANYYDSIYTVYSTIFNRYVKSINCRYISCWFSGSKISIVHYIWLPY